MIYSLEKRCVFRADLKEEIDFFSLMLPGRLFHKVGATNVKALWPLKTLSVGVSGTGSIKEKLGSRPEGASRRVQGINLERYGESLSLTARKGDERTLRLTRSCTGSQ
jgi:hypothetical protein